MVSSIKKRALARIKPPVEATPDEAPIVRLLKGEPVDGHGLVGALMDLGAYNPETFFPQLHHRKGEDGSELFLIHWGRSAYHDAERIARLPDAAWAPSPQQAFAREIQRLNEVAARVEVFDIKDELH